MESIKCWEEESVTTPEPHKRRARVIFAPDKRDVPAFTFCCVDMYPNNSSDSHVHDRPELVYVVSGNGTVICDGVRILIEPDMALLFRPGEAHQFINDSNEVLKCTAFFVPPFSAKDLLK
jgi:mannose-6-phosphate isomerase-like protein (cupin superfamily)